jgi:hypothetical protein
MKRDRFLEMTATVTLIDMLLADPNLSASFKAVFAPEPRNEDYTPEEIAIEAEERAQAEEAQEREERDESFYEDGLWTPYDAPTGGRL